ncbi:hypothetical protein ES705_04060 [subsurface metagenome]
MPNHLFAIPGQRDSAYLNIKINNDATTEVQNEEQIYCLTNSKICIEWNYERYNKG